MAHLAAAQTVRGPGVWAHLAAAATSADESLAAALEAAARDGPPAGRGIPGPARLLEWASELSEDSVGRERRLLAAAVRRVCAGDLGSAGLWDRVAGCAPSALRDCALAGRALLEGRRQEAECQLDRALSHPAGQQEASAAAHGLRAELCAGAALGDETVRAASAGLALARGDRGLERWLTRLIAEGRCYAEGPWSALDTLLGGAAVGSSRLRGESPETATLVAIGGFRVLAGEPDAAISDLAAVVHDPHLPLPADMEARASQWLALGCHLLGAWRHADGYAAAAAEAASRAGPRCGGSHHALRALLAAHRAKWGAAAEHLRDARDCGGSEWPDDAVLSDLAEAATAHARGVLEAGHPALSRLAQAHDAARKYRSLWLPLLAESAVESGAERDAESALSELAALAERVPHLRVATGRLAGRLAERRRDPAAARRHYEAALNLPSECLNVPLQLGLLEHCHGRLLRGLGDGPEGEVWLASACRRLEAAGAVPYLRRCAEELPARRHSAPPQAEPSVLTERERAVARLVADGLTNQQVAARLFVSVKTVEYHLAQIYSKLGITSRRQLSR